MTPVPLKLNNIQKQFFKTQALQGVELNLLPCEFLSLVGPKNSGKTTLMHIVAGSLKPSFGRVLLDGRDVTDMAPSRRGLCSVFHDTPLFPHRTILQNVAYGLKLAGVNRKERRMRAMHMLALANLEDAAGKKPRLLSPYQYKIALLARALVLRPKVLLLDDPFARLQEEDRRRVLAFLKALQQQWHYSILYTTRDRAEAMAVSHRIALIQSGRIQQAGKPEELYHHPENVTSARAMGLVNVLPGVVAARRPGGFVAIDMDGLTLPAQSASPPPAIGEDVLLCLRPEQVHLFDAPRPDSLVSGLFAGTHMESGHRLCVVELPTGRKILCDDPKAEQFEPGARVFVWWDTSKAALLPGEEEQEPLAHAPETGGKEVPLWVP